jgi:hypothetical protein
MTILYDDKRIQKLILETDPNNLNPDFRSTFLGIVDWIESGKPQSLRQITFLEKQHRHHKLIAADRERLKQILPKVDIESLNTYEKNVLDGIQKHNQRCLPLTSKQMDWMTSKISSEPSKTRIISLADC